MPPANQSRFPGPAIAMTGNTRTEFEVMLMGGHPNSLGKTIEVVELVLKKPSRLKSLYACYQSEDEVVRMRVSNAMKRIEKERQDLIVPYIDKFLTEVSAIKQASAQWTLAQLFARLAPAMSPEQRKQAEKVLKRNLAKHDDWIVLSMTMETLATWALSDTTLKRWLKPHLTRLAVDTRKAVAKKAQKSIVTLYQT